jgi:predicted phosphoribosyltransferase
MILESRKHAGILLAERLKKFKNCNGAIYALPRGGVVLGAEIAKALNLPLDLIVSRKIGHPSYPEYAIGAITDHGEKVLNPAEAIQLDPEWLEKATEEQYREAQRRRKLYTMGKPEISAKDRTAIIVDDGIATGYTMQAAIQDIQKQKPSSIIVAVPVTPKEKAHFFSSMVNEFVALDIPRMYAGAVGAYYVNFPQLTDKDVIEILESLKTLAALQQP